MALQRRLHYHRTPRPAHPTRLTPHPVPQSPHRRPPRRERPDHRIRL